MKLSCGTANDADAMLMLAGLNERQYLRYIKTGMNNPALVPGGTVAVRLHQAVVTNSDSPST